VTDIGRKKGRVREVGAGAGGGVGRMLLRLINQ
jgi:hypothetical protein